MLANHLYSRRRALEANLLLVEDGQYGEKRPGTPYLKYGQNSQKCPTRRALGRTPPQPYTPVRYLLGQLYECPTTDYRFN